MVATVANQVAMARFKRKRSRSRKRSVRAVKRRRFMKRVRKRGRYSMKARVGVVRPRILHTKLTKEIGTAMLSGNGLLTITYSGVGYLTPYQNQPLFWDELSNFYVRYTLNAIKIETTVFNGNLSGSSQLNGDCGIIVWPGGSTTPDSSISRPELLENARQGGYKVKMVSWDDGSTTTKKFSMFVKPTYFFGRDQYQGYQRTCGMNTDPPLYLAYKYFVAPLDASSTSSVCFRTRLTFYVTLTTTTLVSTS